MPNRHNLKPEPAGPQSVPFHSSSPQAGKLKILFGYAAGVGKTYAMLDAAREQYKNGADVVIGYVDPKLQPETAVLLAGLPVLPTKAVLSGNETLQEFDLDLALQRKPEVMIVDNLAHTNPPGLRNKKRYQDIEELLNAGIHVYTTVNVEQIESLFDVVQDFTTVPIRETVPDSIFDRADMVKLIDVEPDELFRRIGGEEASSNDPFSKETLRALREIAMRKAADRIRHDHQREQSEVKKTSGTKLLVCIGVSPSSAKCIRWTARTAEAFCTPWVAVYVENTGGQDFSAEEKNNLQANMDLAEQLGAEIIMLSGSDIAAVVGEYAKMSGVTNIVIGKSRNKKTLKNIFEPDLEDRLIAALPDVEIHMIPSAPAPKTFPAHRSAKPNPDFQFSWADFLKTIGALAAATILCLLLKAFRIGDQNLIMVYILSVLVVSRTTSGYIYGVIASMLSVLAFNFFFTIPYFTFYAIQREYPVTFFIMLIAALITSALTVRVKTQAQLAVEREHRTELLYEISKALLATRGLENITVLTNKYLVKLFRRSAILYIPDHKNHVRSTFLRCPDESDASFLQSEAERAVADWVFSNKKRAGAGTDTFSDAHGFYTPVLSQGKVLGVVGLSCAAEKLSQDSRLFLQMIVSQIAMALERQFLSEEQRRILIETEKEKMRSNLLRSISHDLRTPLTCISGASSAILENEETLDRETYHTLLTNIRDESQWLIRMVENILSVTRIHAGSTSVVKSLEAAEEIVAQAVSRVRKRFPERRIHVRVPDELLMVPMDATLIEQVLINLLENAVNHSPADTQIEVKVERVGSEAVFAVIDNGPGIADEDLPYVFDSYVPHKNKSPDSSRGMGIGLSICLSIIKSHSGRMSVINKKEGGAVFRFTLPLEGDRNYGEKTADYDRGR